MKSVYNYSRDNYEIIPYKKLSSNQTKLLETILTIQSFSGYEGNMIGFIKKFVSQLPNVTLSQDKHNNIYVEKHLNTNPPSYLPLMVAHMDTVHEIRLLTKPSALETKNGKLQSYIKNGHVYTTIKYEVFRYPNEDAGGKGSTYWSPTGIGGDDKNGIFILLSILQNKSIPHIKMLFTTEEETGQQGASFAIDNQQNWFSNISYMLEPDRRGNCDIINHWGSGLSYSDEFESIVKPFFKHFKYKSVRGSVTDIFPIFEILNISCFNYSCGYYDPHSSDEYVVEMDIKRALDFTEQLLKHISLDKKYEKTYEKRKTYTYNYTNYPNPSKNWKDMTNRTHNQPSSDYNHHVSQIPSVNNSFLTLSHNLYTDFISILNSSNQTINYLYSTIEKSFMTMEFFSKNLDKYIKSGSITFNEYEDLMFRLIDQWSEHSKNLDLEKYVSEQTKPTPQTKQTKQTKGETDENNL